MVLSEFWREQPLRMLRLAEERKQLKDWLRVLRVVSDLVRHRHRREPVRPVELHLGRAVDAGLGSVDLDYELAPKRMEERLTIIGDPDEVCQDHLMISNYPSKKY